MTWSFKGGKRRVLCEFRTKITYLINCIMETLSLKMNDGWEMSFNHFNMYVESIGYVVT